MCVLSGKNIYNKWKQRTQKVNSWDKGPFFAYFFSFQVFQFPMKSLIQQTRNIDSFSGNYWLCIKEKKVWHNSFSWAWETLSYSQTWVQPWTFLKLVSCCKTSMFALGRLPSWKSQQPLQISTALCMSACKNASYWRFKLYSLKTEFCYQKDSQLTRRYSVFSLTEDQTYPHVEFPALVPWFDLEDVIGSRIASCCLHLKNVRRHRTPGHHIHHSVQDGERLISATGVFSWTHAAANCQR